MYKLIPTLILSIFLSGCAAFAEIRNPIDTTRLAQIESTYGAVLAAAVAYRKSCADRILNRATCAPIVNKMQVANRKVQISLRETRAFIKNNPQLDASSFIEGLRRSVSTFQQIALSNGVMK